MHAPLSFSKRQMAVLGPIVQAFVGAMFKAGRDLASGRTVGAQLVRDDPFGQAKPLDQRFQKTLCGTLVAPRLQDFLKNDPLLVNRAPEPEFPPRDRHHNFVEMPDIPRTRLPPAQVSGDLRGEFRHPTPDRFVGNINATLQEHFLDFAQGEVETDVQPNRVRDDLWWKTVALVADDHAHAQQLRKISNASTRPKLM